MNEESRADCDRCARAMVDGDQRATSTSDDFVEVETPILQPRYGGAFAEPFVTHYNELDADYYLRIATELYLKRLIVGGLEKVYEIGKDFRNEGISYKHQPEFTMLEWYEAYADYRDTMDADRAARRGRRAGGQRHDQVDVPRTRGRLRELAAAEARRRARGAGLWTRDEDELRTRSTSASVDTKHDKTWAQLVDHALERFVEPELIEPTILHDYPIELSPFARATDDDPSIVERFEYFVGGMELGNAFSELNDSEEQAQRFAMQASERAAGAGETEPATRTTSRRSRTGCRPRAGSGSASTDSRWCSPAATRSAT